MSVVYVYVGAEANVGEVAVDLRNQAPTVLIVCCSSGDVTARMQAALSQEAVNKNTRGDGESPKQKPRKNAEDFQVQFSCIVQFPSLIVAGRRPVVKDVDVKETLSLPGGGSVLIAEVGLHVMVQGQLSIRLAAFANSAPLRGGGVTFDNVAEAFENRSVRLIAGEFGETLFILLAAIRKRMAVNVCAMRLCSDKEQGAVAQLPSKNGGPSVDVKIASSAMLLAGPVGRIMLLGTAFCGVSINAASVNTQSFVGEEGKDASHGWPVLGNLKQKEVLKLLPHTQKMLVFIDSNKTHRTPEALQAREQKRRQRADTFVGAAWAQRFRNSQCTTRGGGDCS